jgi:transposase-like protein
MEKPIRSVRYYVERYGQMCPACDSGSISGNNINVDGDLVTQNVSCSDCLATWKDLYQLTGYADLEPGDR